MIRLLFIVLFLTGCAQAPQAPEIIQYPSLDSEGLNKADSPVGLPFTVTISLFDSAEADTSSLYDAQSRVRSVEHRLLPYQLRTTLDRTGYFGAVRVVPIVDPGSELTVRGQVLSSDGMVLGLKIQVTDATGRVWLDQDYWDQASNADYLEEPVYTIDPFQGLYNLVANDMIKVYQQLSQIERQRVVDVATLRYAALLAPEYFERFVAATESGWALVSLPARDDPAMERVARIRDSEFLFADSVDENYERLLREIGPTYAWWRYYSFDLITGNQRLQQIDPTRGATRGTWYSLDRVYKTYRDSRMNEDALRELTDSFDRETTPLVTEVAGQVVELKGTLAEQHDAWRDLMQRYYEAEFQ